MLFIGQSPRYVIRFSSFLPRLLGIGKCSSYHTAVRQLKRRIRSRFTRNFLLGFDLFVQTVDHLQYHTAFFSQHCWPTYLPPPSGPFLDCTCRLGRLPSSSAIFGFGSEFRTYHIKKLLYHYLFNDFFCVVRLRSFAPSTVVRSLELSSINFIRGSGRLFLFALLNSLRMSSL